MKKERRGQVGGENMYYVLLYLCELCGTLNNRHVYVIN